MCVWHFSIPTKPKGVQVYPVCRFSLGCPFYFAFLYGIFTDGCFFLSCCVFYHRGVSINVFWSNLNIFLFPHSQKKRCSSQKSVLSGIRYKCTCGAKRWHSRVASAVQAKRSTKRSNKRRACGCVVSVAKCSTSSRQSGATRSVMMTTAKRSETTHYHRAQASACQRKQCTPYTERRSLRYVIHHLQ